MNISALARLLLAVILFQNPLSSLALSQQAIAADAKPAPKWGLDLSGRWSISEDKKQYEAFLDVDGNGPYTQECGRLTTTEVVGRDWKGRWEQTGNDREGGFALKFSEDGQTAEGRWWYTRVGERRNIPPGQHGGPYYFKRLPPQPASAAPAVQIYPESQTRELHTRMDSIAAELGENARDAVAANGAAAALAPLHGASLSACPGGVPPSTGIPLPGDGPQKTVSDPWESFNRAIFKFNVFIDNYLMQPFIKKAYNPMVPEMLRQMIANGFANLNEPETVISDLLQGKPIEAGKSLARLIVNTTIGLAGMFDVAKKFLGLERKPATIEQAVAAWGVPPGPFLVIPFNPPSNLRDTIIWAGKTYFTPMSYVLGIFGRMGLEALRQTNDRSLLELGYNDPDKLYAIAREAAARP